MSFFASQADSDEDDEADPARASGLTIGGADGAVTGAGVTVRVLSGILDLSVIYLFVGKAFATNPTIGLAVARSPRRPPRAFRLDMAGCLVVRSNNGRLRAAEKLRAGIGGVSRVAMKNRGAYVGAHRIIIVGERPQNERGWGLARDRDE